MSQTYDKRAVHEYAKHNVPNIWLKTRYGIVGSVRIIDERERRAFGARIQALRGLGFGKGVSPSPMAEGPGEGAMVHFCAFWVLVLTLV